MMNEGLFESLVTDELHFQLKATDLGASMSRVDDAEAPQLLVRHVAQALVRRLSVVKDAAQRVALTNEV